MNVLVYAYHEDSPHHPRYRVWLKELVASESSYGVVDLVLSGFLRVVTNPKAFSVPAPFAEASAFAEKLRGQPNATTIQPGSRHWEIFTRLCRHAGAKGNVVPDAFYAALAIESGSEWVTADRGFARFPGLQWRHPLDP